MKLCVLMLGVVAVLSATAAIGAQTAKTADVVVTVSGCLAKGTDGKYTLTNAKTEKNAPGAPSTATWVVDVSDLVVNVLKLDQLVGRRLQVVGRVNTEAKGASPMLSMQSLKPSDPPC